MSEKLFAVSVEFNQLLFKHEPKWSPECTSSGGKHHGVTSVDRLHYDHTDHLAPPSELQKQSHNKELLLRIFAQQTVQRQAVKFMKGFGNEHIFGHTSRPNYPEMAAITKKQLSAAGIDKKFKDLLYMPEWASAGDSIVGELAELLRSGVYSTITHYDFNGERIFWLAEKFSQKLCKNTEMRFVILQNTPYGPLFNWTEKKQYPHVARAAILGDGNMLFLKKSEQFGAVHHFTQ